MDAVEATRILNDAARWLEEKRYAEAEADCERVLLVDAEQPHALFLKARIKTSQGCTAEAIEVYRAMLASNPSIAEAHYNLGCILNGSHQALAQARQHFRDALELRPAWHAALLQLGQICAAVGPLGEAIECYVHALSIQPNDAVVHVQLSELYANTDNLAEAAKHLERALQINPNVSAAARIDFQELAEIQRDRRSPPKKGRYPDAQQIAGDLRGTIVNFVAKDLSEVSPFVHARSTFFTMGSCFARNLAQSLIRQGYGAAHMEISEYINTTYANRCYVDWLKGTLEGDVRDRIDALMSKLSVREDLVARIQNTDVFIYTIGVAPCFFEKGTGRFVMPRPTALNSRALAEKYEFRTTSVSENVENMRYIIEYLRALNPQIKIVLTLSPVPMQMTFEHASAVVADCISKSTLRVAANEIERLRIPGLYYWPSFEIVRWLGGHMGPVYGTDDGAAWHVSERLVDTIIECFLEVFGGKPS